MRGFIGSNGKAYSDAQRRAMFAGGRSDSLVHDKKRNRFVVPAIAAAAGTALVTGAASAAGGEIVKESPSIAKDIWYLTPPGMAMGIMDIPKKISGGKDIYSPTVEALEKGTEGTFKRAEVAAAPAIQTAGEVVGTVAGETVSGLGEPYMLSNSEFMALPESEIMYWSHDKDKDYMDVDAVKKLVKKQYPHADVDTKVKLLDPGKYTQFALKENPGREREAVTSNGFYSPTKDTAYLEKDPNKLNALRATIHELVHDMSDDGVNTDGSQDKYMLNEGYADYVAKRIMTDELKLPEEAVNKTIGYPKEVKQVEHLVALNGRKNVDKAFLVEHSLEGLHNGWRQEAPKTCL